MVAASLFEDLLDQYKIEQHIAEKRYTELYQAYDVDDDSQVRLEILRPEFAENGSFAGRFINRARAIAQIRHSNIASILHIGKTANGMPYVAQAAIDGYPLSHRLEQLSRRNKPANPIYALKLIRQLGDALVLAERLELFHYDLQPDNILLRNVTLPTDDSVVLVDLFIPADRSKGEKLSGVAPSSWAYLSPEQRAGKEVTAASHVYSLGAILFHLLAGKAPGGPVTIRDVGLENIFGRATALERGRGDLAPRTYNLVTRSMRKDPRRRYPNVETFVAALDKALMAEEAHVGASGTRGAAVDRRPGVWLLPLLIVALFLAVGAVATHNLVYRNSKAQAVVASQVAGGDATGAPAVVMVPTTEVTATIPPTTAGEPTAVLTAGNLPVAGMIVGTETAVGTIETGTPELPSPSPTPTATASSTMTPSLTSTTAPPRVRVILNLVNLRSGPGVMYSLRGTATAGEVLEVIAWNNDKDNPWYLVLTDNQRIGWIAAAMVQAESAEELVAVPVAATLPPMPVPTMAPTSTPTNMIVVTIVLTTDPGNPGGGDATQPPEEPTARPTEPQVEPTRTPPPFTPSP